MQQSRQIVAGHCHIGQIGVRILYGKAAVDFQRLPEKALRFLHSVLILQQIRQIVAGHCHIRQIGVRILFGKPAANLQRLPVSCFSFGKAVLRIIKNSQQIEQPTFFWH